jgi:hypothetical protein
MGKQAASRAFTGNSQPANVQLVCFEPGILTMSPETTLSPLYARYLSAGEKKALRCIPVDDSSSEINLLRVLTAHLMKFQRSAPPDLFSRIQTLRTCVILNETLAILVRWHNRDHAPLSDLDADFNEAVDQVNAEFFAA